MTTDIITRKDAIAQGRTRYFTGKLCSYGHIAERFTSTGHCIECRRITRRKIYHKNPEKYREKNKRWKASQPKGSNYHISQGLRIRLYHAICDNSKVGSAVRDLGCSIANFKAYIEKQWLPGMTWENWSYTGWHLDHIKPLSSFDLTIREQFLAACHYTNLQPLWAKDNYTKKDKVCL